MLSRRLVPVFFAVLAAALCGAVETVQVTEIAGNRFTAIAGHPGLHAKVGDKIHLSVRADTAAKRRFRVELVVNGDRRGEARIMVTGGQAEYTFVPTVPGSVGVVCTALDTKGEILRGPRNRRVAGGIGVLVSPEEIRPGNPDEPADFDEFWKARRAELDRVPVKAERTEAGSFPEYPNVVCCDVKVDCAGGAPVSGYLCMPKNAKPKSLPAIVVYHGSGVRSAQKQFKYGSKAIAFDVNAHGIDNGKPRKFYDELNRGALKGYTVRGFGDRDNCYFIGMIMRVMRALDYVKSLPEWNGELLIVSGPSQGGGQALAAAALDDRVTLCSTGVPALCDLGGRAAGRRSGWPAYTVKPLARQSEADFIEGAAYVDGVFFARRIKCPIYFSTGLIDNVCHTAAVYSAYNALPKETKKNMLIVPTGHHHGTTPYNPGAKAIDRTLGLE